MNRKQRRATKKTRRSKDAPRRPGHGGTVPLAEATSLLEQARRAMAGGDYLQSFRAYRRLFDSEHANPSLLVEACEPLIRAHALPEVESFCEQGVKRFPTSAAAWNLLGQARFNVGRPAEALAAYRSALEHDPEMAQALAGIAQVQERTHRLEEALASIDRAVGLAQGFHFLGTLRGMILRRLGRLGEAMAQQRDVLEKTDGADAADARQRHTAWCEIAEIEKSQGRPDAAKEALYAGKAAQAVLRGPYLEQFPAFREAAESRIAGLDREKAESWFHRAGSAPEGPQALIVGHPRSGTTLVEQMLAAHRGAVTLDEREVLVQAESIFLGQAPAVPALDRASADQAAQFRSAYRTQVERYLGEPVGGRLLVDKRPDSLLLLPTVLRMMPDIRVVVVIRDPRDVCTSCYEQAFQLGTVSAQFHSIASTCRFYAWFMSFWLRVKAVLPESMWHEVRYETLVEDTERCAREMVDFVGLPWDEGVLAFSEQSVQRVVSTPSYAAVAQPVTAGSVGRWRAYAEAFEAEADTLAPYLDALGYDAG